MAQSSFFFKKLFVQFNTWPSGISARRGICFTLLQSSHTKIPQQSRSNKNINSNLLMHFKLLSYYTFFYQLTENQSFPPPNEGFQLIRLQLSSKLMNYPTGLAMVFFPFLITKQPRYLNMFSSLLMMFFSVFAEKHQQFSKFTTAYCSYFPSFSLYEGDGHCILWKNDLIGSKVEVAGPPL